MPCRPWLAEAGAVRQIDVEPSVVIVVKESDAAAFGFNDVTLVVGISPNIRTVESRFASDVDELHRR